MNSASIWYVVIPKSVSINQTVARTIESLAFWIVTWIVTRLVMNEHFNVPDTVSLFAVNHECVAILKVVYQNLHKEEDVYYYTERTKVASHFEELRE